MIHEGGIATPFIVHWPKGIAPALRGKIVHEPAHLIDIMPTLLDVTETAYPEKHQGHDIIPLEGLSLKPFLGNGSAERSDAIYFEHMGNRGVRLGKWKLVAERRSSWELYDMEQDRTEHNDLAKQMPEKVKEPAQLYDAWAARAFVN